MLGIPSKNVDAAIVKFIPWLCMITIPIGVGITGIGLIGGIVKRRI